MSFVIKCVDRGMYVARVPLPSTYTRTLSKAHRFPTREAAERECCGNEVVIPTLQLRAEA